MLTFLPPPPAQHPLLPVQQTQPMSDPTAPTLEDTGDLFAGMKKKKKSTKKVNFDEEEADVVPSPSPAAPAAAAPVPTAATTTDSPAPATPADAPAPSTDELDFSDLKKKRKKKVVRIASDDDEDDSAPAASGGTRTVDSFGNETIVAAPAANAAAGGTEGGDEFADLKLKKKKKGGKKATFDLEAFEKELADADASTAAAAAVSAEDSPAGGSKVATPAGSKGATPAGSDGEAEGGEDDDVDEPVEGEDPFEKEEGEEGTLSKAEAAAEAKLWLVEGDRDYHYTEVRVHPLLCPAHARCPGTSLTPPRLRSAPAAPRPVLLAPLRLAPVPVRVGPEKEVHDPATADAPRGQQALHLRQRRRHLQEDAPPARACHPVPLCRARNER